MAALMLVLGMTGNAQFWDKMTNPKVSIPLTHPPDLGLQINKIAFGPVTGEGANEFVDALTERFVRSGIEVVERSRLEALLKEQNFSLTGYVDQQSAAQMGKILGPAVMLFVNMQRHTFEKKRLYENSKDYKGIVHRTNIARTQAFVRGSIRSVDLATGRVFAAKVLEASPLVENRITDGGLPEFQDEFALFDRAGADIVLQATRLFLPWTETVQVYYFDDNTCGLKQAFARVKVGDAPGSLQQSMSNLEQCKVLPKADLKALSHAYHNVGMSNFMIGDYQKAIENLNLAQQTKPASIFVEALAEVRKADMLLRESRRVEERAAITAADAEQRVQASATAAGAQTMTNKDVTALVSAKLPAAIIITKIRSSTCKFDTSTEALIQLSQSGVPADVITAMMECKK
ncbi:MAG: hypothetical protein A3H96_26385 [Acidobacteria bacterium RIFCSPLOWO2_02_FULL_67_36]|nr:MAG: hypothetical protein A3H96_26385 [Acidobacteria bacterium RIFCSPLOWO2_02_FULL_67_36]OFW22028.1 MAG: hypothetical protein A3G21_13575 [Acidobacteria bacterium RIFCSPLOWO2_12_FULL_66_21]